MNKHLLTSVIAGLFVTGMSEIAEANLFQGNSNGIFVNPNTGINTGVGTSHFTTGTGTPTWLDFSGVAFDVNPDIPFTFGELTYFNGSTNGGSDADTVQLDVSLNFKSPLSITQDFLYTLTFYLTPNTGTPEQNADYLYLPTSYPPMSFAYGGTNYTLEFQGFGAVDSNGFITTVDQFHVYEGASASAQLLGKITEYQVSVPEPATILLLATGVTGLVGARLKKRGNKNRTA